MRNPIREVQQLGQSIWLDHIRRGLITSGELQRMVDADGLLGVTSNPAIFEKALAGSTDYDPAFQALVRKGARNAREIFDQLAIQDVQLAADVLHPTYLHTQRRDGYVSLEVSPYLAFDTAATVAEARRLWSEVARDNVMIKVPATPEGIPAIEALIAEGINVNVTLLFSVAVYETVVGAYMSGLEYLVDAGGEPGRVASVASFFVSRIDSLVDDRISQELEDAPDPERRKRLESLLGRVAIANAKVAYARFQELYAGPRWRALAERGARVQRLLWGSTGTKNPRYSPTLYVDELIGKDTVDTVPAETYLAFKRDGRVRPSLTDGLEPARDVIRTLEDVGISLDDVTDTLLQQGVRLFSDAFDRLLGAVEKKRQALLGSGLARQRYTLGADAEAVQRTLESWRERGDVRRLWARDASLWTGSDEDRWLGWLHAVDGWHAEMHELARMREAARAADHRHAVVLGMGGSSLWADVLRQVFGGQSGHPRLLVLDSTVPARVRAVERAIDLRRTLFIVASKSGRTLETDALARYFFDAVERQLGVGTAGGRFVAITDLGSALHETARVEGYGHVAFGVAAIPGRFSALTNFGMIPAAVAGIDVEELIESTEVMVQACASVVPPEENLGVQLGAILGTLASRGRDKLTILASPALRALGAWIEQLVAESTGKDGKGIVPIDGEQPGLPGVYGKDRLFVWIRLEGDGPDPQEPAVAALEAAGHPVVRIALSDPIDVGQEVFRWEMATAVASAILGVNPFDQPDVDAAKAAAREHAGMFERPHRAPDQVPLAAERGLELFADPRNAEALATLGPDLTHILGRHLGRIRPGDYFAIHAYLPDDEESRRTLSEIRHAVRDAKRVATMLGYGPRLLHSTGQLDKGGPNTGVFLQITCDSAEDLAVPGQPFTFGALTSALAEGDLDALAERGRRLLRVHLPTDVAAGLTALCEAVKGALRT